MSERQGCEPSFVLRQKVLQYL